jgi:ribosomal protein S18 acetylase RimI-like enzyme
MKIRKEKDLSGWEITEIQETFRSVDEVSVDKLAEAFLDAFIGTIDYEGEDIEDALNETTTVSKYGEIIRSATLCLMVGNEIASAVWTVEKDHPLISYLITVPKYKRQGYGRKLMTQVLNALKKESHRKVVLYVTADNSAVSLYESMGFVAVSG